MGLSLPAYPRWLKDLLCVDACRTTLGPTAERSPRPQVESWSTCTQRNSAPTPNVVTAKLNCVGSPQLAPDSCRRCPSAIRLSAGPMEDLCATSVSGAGLSVLSSSKNGRSWSVY